MKNTKIQFKSDELLVAVEDVRDHVIDNREVAMHTTKIIIPDPAPKKAYPSPSKVRSRE